MKTYPLIHAETREECEALGVIQAPDGYCTKRGAAVVIRAIKSDEFRPVQLGDWFLDERLSVAWRWRSTDTHPCPVRIMTLVATQLVDKKWEVV